MEKQRVKVGGKFGFKALPKNIQKSVLSRLAEKDSVAAKGLLGECPGIKIDGQVVTKDNIHEFERKERPIKKSEAIVEQKEIKTTKSKRLLKKKEKIIEIDDLINVKGIGIETLSDLKRVYSSVPQLKRDLEKDAVPIRNDIVNKLKRLFFKKI